MEHDEKAFADMIAERLLALGTTAHAIEKQYGLPPDAVRNIMRGAKKAGTPLNRAREVCEALGLELYIGPRRDVDAPPPALEIEGDDFATIKRIAAQASAGPGALNDDAQVIGHMAFRRDWLAARGINPGRCVLLTVKGDSMDPSFRDGDLVMLDRDRTEIGNGKPYILTDIDGETKLKRIHVLGRAGLVLVSDNAAHPPELRNGADAERVKVLGRVVWSGHNWG